MANNIIQVKRTAVSGRVANSLNTPDLQPGELSMNMTDQILYSTNGEVFFELGANVDIQVVRTALYVGANVDLTTTGLFIGNTSVNASVNSTAFSGTANNALYLGGTAAADYQTEAGLSANVATLTANNANYLGGVAAASYQTEAGLAANVATMASNSTTYIPATNGIVSNSTGVWITANAGLLTNSTGLHVGTGNGIVVDTDSIRVLANTGTVVNSTGVFVNATYIGTLSANNAAYLGGTAAADYQTEAGLSANVATLTANNASYLGGLAASGYANLSVATFTTSVNVGANVQVTTSTIKIGNTTANLTANSILLSVANASGTTNVQPTSIATTRINLDPSSAANPATPSTLAAVLTGWYGGGMTLIDGAFYSGIWNTTADDDRLILGTGTSGGLTERWAVDLNGLLVPGANNTYDFGKTTNCARNIYAGTDIQVAGVSVKPWGTQAIWIEASAMTPRVTNGPAVGLFEHTTNLNMVRTLNYDTTTAETAQFSIRMPKSWDEGTVTFQPVISQGTTTTNFGVVFSLSAVACANNESGNVAFGSVANSAITGSANQSIYIGNTSDPVTVAGSPGASEYVMFAVTRQTGHGSDTMAIDARLLGVTLFINTNAGNDA